jgi:FxsC-like protein
MPAGYSPQAGDPAPYFFLSYAHTPKQDPNDPGDPDKWVVNLFRDLCAHIMNMTNLPHGARAGFMDRELRSGSDWPFRLAQALATCRVFVPLYSQRYFGSERCGKEWFAFSLRVLNHTARGAEPAEAIIPALWVPVGLGTLPEPARSIQFDHRTLGDRYGTHGFYGIIKLSRYKNDYEEAVYELARRIVDVAERTAIGPAEPTHYDTLESAFGRQEPNLPGDRRIRVTVVAPDVTGLPPGRGAYHYGQTAREWNPYRPDSVRPLADHAADLIRNLDYRPDAGCLDEDADELLSDDPPTGPGLLLVDAWATVDPGCHKTLRRLDALSKPWISVMVPWNRLDAETTSAAAKLRHSLETSLHHKLAEGRIASRTAVNGVPSLEEFGMALPAVVRAAARQYLKHAQAFPPAGPVVERPRLRGPEAIEGPADTEYPE